MFQVCVALMMGWLAAERAVCPVNVSKLAASVELADAKVHAPVPNDPATTLEAGSPVQFVNVPDVGVPRTGVTSVGVFANTAAPDPVSSVTAEARLDEDGVAKKVATLVPSPDMPVLTGRPVQFVSVPDDGVPNAPPEVKPVAKVRFPEPSVCKN